MRGGYGGGHLGEYLEEYADGSLDEAATHRAATHLVSCAVCREDVMAERAIVRRLRAVSVDPSRQASLVAGLLAFVPESQPPLPVGRPEVTTLAPSAPAQYCGRRRTPVVGVAVVALGCFGALAMTSVAPHRTAPGESPVVAVARTGVLTDEVTPPRIQTVRHRTVGASMAKSTMSGTIAP